MSLMANFLDLMKRKMIFIKLLAAFLGLWLAGLLLACANPPSSLTPVPPPLPPELILYDWEGDMPQAVLDGFTQAYGVKIIYEVYESQEEAIEKLRAGRAYDVVVIESRVIPLLVQEGLLAQLDYRHIPNFKNISANFRDLIYDPSNQHTIPYNWGTTGLVVRSDLVTAPVTRWADLWNPRYAGRVGIWQGQPREVLALTLKSLGYSANSEKPAELEAALTRLLLLKPNLLFIEDYDLASSASLMASGQAIISMGYAGDVLQGREENRAITYVLPQEGALLWGDNFAIPATSAHQQAAALFLNYLLQPEVNAQIANENLYATPNEAARPFIKPEILNDPIIFPPEQDIKNSELILPLSPAGQELYNDIWERFLAAN